MYGLLKTFGTAAPEKIFAILFALVAFHATTIEARATPVLDSSFGNSGVARIGVPSGAEDTPSASALQRDGKLLLAGRTVGRQTHTFVLRLLPNGVLDATFGQNGVAFVDLPNGYYIYSVEQIEQGADGSILVSGASMIPGGGYSHVFARLTTAGVLDTSFGTQGFFSAGPLSDTTPARFMQQADGGLLIISDATQGSQFALRLTRLNQAGVRDSAYAPNGEKILSGLPPNFAMASGVSVVAEPNGGFTVMARATFTGGTYLLVRVTDAGTLNFGFGNGGLISGYDVGNPFDSPAMMVRTANGGLLLMGDAVSPPPDSSRIGKIVLWQVTVGGLADASFGTAGRLEVGNGNSYSYYFQLAALSDGSIALVDTGAARVMRFDSSGILDSAFGTGGSTAIALPVYAGFNALGVLPNSTGGLLIPAAANLTTACGFYCYPRGVDAAVASLDGRGRLLTGYGRGNGFAVWNNAEYSNDEIDTILVEASGKVVLAGTSDEGATFDYLLARLAENGSPDSAFGTNGRVSPGQYSHFIGKVRAAEQASGAITVVTGAAIGSHGQMGAVTAFRLDSAGMLDAGFAPALAAPTTANADIALGVRPDGRLLYGTTTFGTVGNAILQQTMPDGTPDLNFGVGGKVAFPLSAQEYSRQADLVLLGDGSAVFAVLTNQNLRLYKVNARGLPVASFGTSGQVTYAAVSPNALSTGKPFSLLSLADGSLLAGISAYAPAGSPSSLFVIRISSLGTLIGANNLLEDQSYLTWSFAALPDASVAITRSRNDGTTSSAALYRLLPDNSLDASFGAGGAYPLPGMESVSALALDAHSRLLVAGQDATSAVLARYDLSGTPADDSVVEFYNTNLDNYFITADAGEASAIDGGSAGPGWRRTGYSFKSGGTTSVCRFYGSLSPGPNSHFYTLAGPECDGLKHLQASTPATQKRWNFESLDFVSTPPNNGACPGGTTPVYRAYNNGFGRGVDSNHRITTSPAAVQEVVTRGWTNEGVVMCAPN